MKTWLFFFLFLHLLGGSAAVYKQWIPNTNFENASNWDQGRVPCTNDVVIFGSSEAVSIFVQSPHTLTDMVSTYNIARTVPLAIFWFHSGINYCQNVMRVTDISPAILGCPGNQRHQQNIDCSCPENPTWLPTFHEYLPLNGEFIMAPGAGFAAFDGNYEPGRETGSEIKFTSSGSYQWYDPTLWHAAVSMENLGMGTYIFSVDEGRVPCQYDDVLFQPETSFWVNIESSEQIIHLRSISILGQKFTHDDTLAEYMQSRSAKLQFHGQGAFQLSDARCPDKSGCECGNTAEHQRICAALLQNSEGQCPVPTCQNPLEPIGHCCEICGAMISLDYSSGFDIELYRDRILHTFLRLPTNAGVQMAISKVHGPRTFLGLFPRSLAPLIQIVLIDNRTGSQSGTHAKQLAEDIMNDITEYGDSFGIVGGSLQTATGSNWTAQGAGRHIGATITGTVVGLFLIFLLLGIVLLLYRKGILRSFPPVHMLSRWKQMKDLDSLGEAVDKGFDNPMFDTPSSLAALDGACSMEEMGSKNSQVYFINPLYDETELKA